MHTPRVLTSWLLLVLARPLHGFGGLAALYFSTTVSSGKCSNLIIWFVYLPSNYSPLFIIVANNANGMGFEPPPDFLLNNIVLGEGPPPRLAPGDNGWWLFFSTRRASTIERTRIESSETMAKPKRTRCRAATAKATSGKDFVVDVDIVREDEEGEYLWLRVDDNSVLVAWC